MLREPPPFPLNSCRTILLLLLLLQPLAAAQALPPPPPPPPPPQPLPLVGARYFAGWYNCSQHPAPSCYSHFRGFAPTGAPTQNFFPLYPERLPLLGLYTTALATVAAEVRAADAALDFFSMLYYDGDATCASSGDPNLAYCLDSALALMVGPNTSAQVWAGARRLHFFITYSNDVDRGGAGAGMFVGPAGRAAWRSRSATWLAAMAHPRYLRIGGRPVFEVLIPDVLVAQCGGNASLASELLEELRAGGQAAGLGRVLIGGGWQNPSTPSTPPPPPRPHPGGYMAYPATDIPCAGGGSACDLAVLPSATLPQCSAACNATGGCAALVLAADSGACTLKSQAGPGAPAPAALTAYVRVQGGDPVHYDFTATYNGAVPVCPGEADWVCPQYRDSWWPNATPSGARIFPYAQCADFQAAARGNHSSDPVPYLPNLIAGFDPRPWQEPAPSFAAPSAEEWEAALLQVRALVSAPGNAQFGFPDATAGTGVRPAVMIYAWDEFGEGGILAPTAGAGTMMLDAVARVFGGA
jgi:hypothetical protein